MNINIIKRISKYIIIIKREREDRIRKIILIISIINIIIIMNYYITYNINYNGYQNINNILNINWGIDGISMILILLTGLLGPIAIISNWKNIKKNKILYNISIILIIILMILNFICLDLISFYILFESILGPLYIIIGIYGGEKKREAAYSILIYTLASSLFMLLSIITYNIIIKTTDFIEINSIILSIQLQSIIFIGIMIGISVKTPLMPFHTWLPIVHSESPLGGSILLAGIILKLAIYGIIRLILPNLSEITLLWTPIIYVIGILTLIYSSLITLNQRDLKEIVAYSSISHLSICILSIFSNNIIGINGSIISCIAHGLVSPALFILVGGILYDRYHTRFLDYYQGLSNFYPILCIYLFLFSLFNIGIPLSGNFVGEFLSIVGTIIRHPLIGILSILSVFLSACYQMKITNRLISGSFSVYLHITNDVSLRELFLLNFLFFSCLLIGIYPSFLTSLLEFSSSVLIYNIII